MLESVAGVAMPELLPTIRKPRLISWQDDMRYAGPADAAVPDAGAGSRAHAPGHVAVSTSLLLALMVQVHRIVEVLDAGGNAPHQPISRQARQIEKFRSLVDRHYRQQKSLQAYASQMGMTPGQLSRLCREALDMSGLDVINARVLHEAQRELVYTHMPIKQLAAELGYSDDAYFSRFFRKHTGLSPSAFRAQALAQLHRQHQSTPPAH